MADQTVASEVRNRVLRSRDRFWQPEDFDGSPQAVAKELSRLNSSDELRRVRRGLYWRGTPTRLGMAPPPSERFVATIVDLPGTGPAGRSAALSLGLSTQVPRHDTVAVPGRPPTSGSQVKFVSRAASTKRRSERLTPVEVALLEVLRDWETIVDVPADNAIERIDALVHEGSIRVDRVVRASATEPARVRERLRQLLVTLERDADATRIRPARRAGINHTLGIAG